MTTETKKLIYRALAIVFSIVGGIVLMVGCYQTIMGSFSATLYACGGLFMMTFAFQALDLLRSNNR